MAWISGHFGPDFSKYDPNEFVQNIEIPGIQGLFDSIIYAKGGAPVTVQEAALIYAEGMGMPRLVATPSDIADQLEFFMDEGGADGFMLAATYTPGCFEEFVDLVLGISSVAGFPYSGELKRPSFAGSSTASESSSQSLQR